MAGDLVFVPRDKGQVPDSDGDGLNDAVEFFGHGTDMLLVDSDGDGFDDGVEVAEGTNPTDPTSSPAAPPAVIPAFSNFGLRLLIAAMILLAARRGLRGRRA